MRLTDAYQEFLLAYEGCMAPRTVNHYRYRLGRLLGFLDCADLEAVTISDLRKWRARLVSLGLSPYTVHGYLRVARRFFKWCVEEGFLTASPATRLKLPKLPDQDPKAVTPADLQKLLEAARHSSPRDYAIVCFLADTGCRVSGLCGLRPHDLDLSEGRAYVTEKGSRRRAVYLTFETVKAILAYERVRPDGPTLFLGKRGPLTRSGIYRILEKLAQAGGVTGRFNPHAFRHGAARGMLDNGADLSVVADLLGHKSPDVTRQFYARWTDKELKERHSRYSWLQGVDSQHA